MTDSSHVAPLVAPPLHQLRRRSSTKWRTYPADVLPLFVAELDFALAPPITAVLQRAVADGDTGYTPPDPGIRQAFADYADRRWGWDVAPERVRSTTDVMTGVVELLRRVIRPGDRVVITPPVYPPFTDCIEEAGGVVESVPLTDTGSGWRLDAAGLDAAFARGARAMLLCNPHNPTGTVHTRDELAELADIAARHAVTVISDEIHAPLTHEGAAFTPYLASSPVAAESAFAVTSASKAYNLAGLKCAVMVAASDRTAAVLTALPAEVEWRTGLFGALGNVAAFSPESDTWLAGLLSALDANRRLLADLLREHVPAARYRMPDAGFLAWVDLRALEWGDDPAGRILREARVALNPGPAFGPQGAGHVRVNFGCSPDVLREAVARIGALVAS